MGSIIDVDVAHDQLVARYNIETTIMNLQTDVIKRMSGQLADIALDNFYIRSDPGHELTICEFPKPVKWYFWDFIVVPEDEDPTELTEDGKRAYIGIKMTLPQIDYLIRWCDCTAE